MSFETEEKEIGLPALLGEGELALLERLFDTLPDLVFFAKDAQGRYRGANRGLLQRCGLRRREALIGRTAADLFPGPMGIAFLEQDHTVMRAGLALHQHLELHLYADGQAGWCLTDKLPLRDAAGAVCGLVGLSRDLGLPDCKHPDYQAVAAIAAQIRARHAEPLQLGLLAAQAGLSMDRLERMFQRVFQLRPRDMLVQARINAARQGLMQAEALPLAELALACGYADQSAFCRQFKATVGLTPGQFRQLHLGAAAVA